MTLLYPYKSTKSDEELRYSLRSVCKNLPHTNVLIVGQKPSWLVGVDNIRTPALSNKHLDITDKVKSALEFDAVSEDFIYMNDDMFVIKPVEHVHNFNRGTIEEVMAEIRAYGHKSGDYLNGMRRAKVVLEDFGVFEPLSYELHIPMLFNKSKLQQIFDSFDEQFQKYNSMQFRSLYGNLELDSSRRIQDVKVRSGAKSFNRNTTYLSTDNNSFANAAVGQFIRDTFSEPCKYER